MSLSPSSKFVFIAGVSVSIVVALLLHLRSSQSKKAAETERGEDNTTDIALPELKVIDISSFTAGDSSSQRRCTEECLEVARALREYGVVIVRDQRASVTDNDAFIDMMERYYAGSDGIRDSRPEYHYQVGVTPSRVERPRNHTAQMETLSPEDKPLSSPVPEHDPKWRFFWRIGAVPKETNFPLLNMDAVIPVEIPEWSVVMDAWGNKMLDAMSTVAEMAALGFDLPPDAFTSRLQQGPHLLAPTGSDYSIFNEEGTVLAGYHYDLNFLTIHGKSRYPGLYIWTRRGKRVAVSVPQGCLLVQAGKQLEHLTGGHVVAGFHEVVVSKDTVAAIERRRGEGRSLWRISSTLFGHIQSDQLLEPLLSFSTEESRARYPSILAGDQVREELQAIALDTSSEMRRLVHHDLERT